MKKIKEMKKELLIQKKTLKVISDCSECIKNNRKTRDILMKSIGELTKEMEYHLKNTKDEEEIKLISSMYNEKIQSISESIEKRKEDEEFLIKRVNNFLMEVWF